MNDSSQSRSVADLFHVLLAALILMLAAGCATTPRAPQPVPLEQAQVEIPADQLIDIVIVPFDSGVPEDPADRDENVFVEVRKAEARYLAAHLKKTLESSGQWGAVGVAPAIDQTRAQDIGLQIDGTIIESNGEALTIAVEARDTTGRLWLDRRYQSRLPVSSYTLPPGEQREPFQHLYNEIANDLVEVRKRLSPRDLVEVNQVGELRFAESLAPDAFGNRLETDSSGRTRVLRLPSHDDAVLGHVRAIRDRDRALRETLDEGYSEFYDDLFEPYHRWRSFNANETIALRKVRNEGYMKMGLGILATVGGFVLSAFDGGIASELLVGPMIIGGIYGATQGYARLNEASIHVAAIQELGNSFDADVTPRVVQIKGETVRITGSAETQYQEWRRLLRAIYQAETGLPVADGE